MKNETSLLSKPGTCELNFSCQDHQSEGKQSEQEGQDAPKTEYRNVRMRESDDDSNYHADQAKEDG